MVVLVGMTVLTSSVILTKVPAVLLVLVVAGVLCRSPTMTRVILRTGIGLGFPSVVVFIPKSSRWCRCSCPERGLRELSLGDEKAVEGSAWNEHVSTRWTAVMGDRSFAQTKVSILTVAVPGVEW